MFFGQIIHLYDSVLKRYQTAIWWMVAPQFLPWFPSVFPLEAMDVFPFGHCFSELTPLISVTVCSVLCKQWSFIHIFIHSLKLFAIFNRNLFHIIRYSYICSSACYSWMWIMLWSPSEIDCLQHLILARVTNALSVHPSNQDIVEISAFICV